MQRRDSGHIGRRMLEMELPGRIWRRLERDKPEGEKEEEEGETVATPKEGKAIRRRRRRILTNFFANIATFFSSSLLLLLFF